MSNNTLLKVLCVVAVAAALVAFGCTMYLINDNASLKEQLASSMNSAPEVKSMAPAMPRPVVSAKDGKSEEIAALNAYIDRLEAENKNLKQQLAQAPAPGQRRGPGGRGGRPNLEELKETNPERYEQIQRHREAMQAALQERAQRRSDYFANLDTSKLSAEQKSTLSDYQTLLADVENTIATGGDFRSLRESGMELFRMRGEVQNILVENLGTQLGADNEALQQGLQQISEITGGFGNPMQGLPMPPMGGGMMGGPRGGRR